MSVRFSSPVFPGEDLTTEAWDIGQGRALFRTLAKGPGEDSARVVLGDGVLEFEA
jgi:hypothetical protein